MTNSMDLRSLLAAGLGALWLAGCPAEKQDNPPPPLPPPPPPACTADSPVCDPGCAAGSHCEYSAGSCACAADGCNAAAPTCAPACGSGFVCNTSCGCEPAGCQPDAPRCPGSGPNAGCAAGFFCDASCTCQMSPPPPPANILRRASRSTAVDVAPDDSVAAMVNTDDGSVSFFNLAEETRSSRVSTSRLAASEPMSVVFHPSGAEVWVANRAAGSVSRITGVNTTQPVVAVEIELGGEPMGIALSPGGTRAFVTDWVSGLVHVIDTQAARVERVIAAGGSPFAVAVTNDLDNEEGDEKVLVTQFFARPRAGAAVVEGTDDGKEGLVQVFGVGAARVEAEIPLAPIASCFSAPVGTTDVTSGCFPNQLHGITVHTAFGKTRAYVVSVGASPAGPVNFNHNVQALVSVIDLATLAEEPALTKNLNALIKAEQVDNDGDDTLGRRFLNAANAIDFVPRDDAAIGYVSSAGSDVVLRVAYGEDGSVHVGSNLSFNIAVGQNPQGLVVKHSTTNAGALVANLITRNLSLVSFRDQVQTKAIESTAQPTDQASAAFRQWRGKRFFNTSTGIWGKEGWGSCQGCHPFGLTDNVTWKFPAGPRQTVSMDGQYASNDPSDMRALNWTAIFDETHDFENNTRTVSGGKGALQNAAGPLVSPMGPLFSAILVEDQTNRENHQALNGSMKFLSRTTEICTNAATCPDWDLVDAYVQSIRSPRGKPAATSLVAQGRALFEDAGCNKCHAGAKWTVSRTFHKAEVSNGTPPTRVFEVNRAFTTAMDPSALRGLPRDVVTDTTLVAGDDSDMGTPALKRQACNVRQVGTFGLGDAAETRENGSPAQGRKGYNPPSLLALAVGAPYFHNGSARTLEDLFAAPFTAHAQAGNPNFAPTAAEREALAAFLLSIDESTAPFPIQADTVLCPPAFTP